MNEINILQRCAVHVFILTHLGLSPILGFTHKVLEFCTVELITLSWQTRPARNYSFLLKS